MKRNTVKTYLAKLLKKHPKAYRYEAVAKELEVTPRWVRYLENGEKAPSAHLRKLIRLLAIGK